jgi:Spy/CpxP family protein refolding chaperone
MRRPLALLTGLALLGAACGQNPTGNSGPDQESLTLLPDFAESMATSVDGAGIGGVGFPDELKPTAEQKAAIAALHEAFKAANAADFAALKALEAQARAAHAAGKTREEIRAILVQGAPILLRLHAAFAVLQVAIFQVYTPEQQAWITAHRPKPCGPGGPPKLTDEQIHQIRALQQAFMEEVKDEIALIRQVIAEAHAAAQAGASRERIAEILHQADAAKEAVRHAEARLQAAIDAVLTPEQRAARCVPGPRRP